MRAKRATLAGTPAGTFLPPHRRNPTRRSDRVSGERALVPGWAAPCLVQRPFLIDVWWFETSRGKWQKILCTEINVYNFTGWNIQKNVLGQANPLPIKQRDRAWKRRVPKQTQATGTNVALRMQVATDAEFSATRTNAQHYRATHPHILRWSFVNTATLLLIVSTSVMIDALSTWQFLLPRLIIDKRYDAKKLVKSSWSNTVTLHQRGKMCLVYIKYRIIDSISHI